MQPPPTALVPPYLYPYYGSSLTANTLSPSMTHLDDSPITYTPAFFGHHCGRTPKTPTCKRTLQHDENTPPSIQHANTTPPLKKTKYTARRSPEEKLAVIFEAISGVNWTKSKHGAHSHAAYASKFLGGHCNYGVGAILDLWLRSPGGKTSSSCTDCICSVSPTSSQHTKELHWADMGSTTATRVAEIIRMHQPLTWKLMMAIAARKPRTRNGVLQVRKTRPLDLVCMRLISSLNFSRNQEAQFYPFTEAMYLFAMTASYEVFAYNSRVAATVSYGTVYRALRGLSKQEALLTEQRARDTLKWGVLVMDNVQNFLTQRDTRIGRTNKMNIGLAATYVELEDINPQAYDLDRKHGLLLENRRASLTVTKLVGYIDQTHNEEVMALHWLRILSNYIPELESIKPCISNLFRTRVAKKPLPIKVTPVHPLATSGKNETVTSELKDALIDFLEQLGQKPDDYLRRLMLVSGDGLTFEKILQLKKYMQFHADPLQSFKLLEPCLAVWHTLWTDLSRLFEAHWGTTLNRDPSTLGHSAAKIKRKPPPNLKKVDYYSSAELAYLVLDVRIIDCWRIFFKQDDIHVYFRTLAMENNLPTIENLLSAAKKLHRMYSSTRALHHALGDVRRVTEWSTGIPEGTTWISPPFDVDGQFHTSASVDSALQLDATQSMESNKQDDIPSDFHGDLVLAKSIAFMRDALVSREAAYAAAEGDVGRVYEAMKLMLFTFAGSSHSKYVTYLLEMISALEVESTEELRDAMLRSMLVNLTGCAGAFMPVDFMQEYFNRLLQAIVQKKGEEYGAQYIRSVISRNLHHLGRIKKEFRDGAHLSTRSGKHKAPHTRAEVKTLLEEYKHAELHLRRAGRRMGDDVTDIRNIDEFERGIEQLRKTKLPAWIRDTTSTRGLDPGLTSQSHAGTQVSDDREYSGNSSNDSATQTDELSPLGSMYVVDGELVIDVDMNDFSTIINDELEWCYNGGDLDVARE